jgi:hypothetical protein
MQNRANLAAIRNRQVPGQLTAELPTSRVTPWHIPETTPTWITANARRVTANDAMGLAVSGTTVTRALGYAIAGHPVGARGIKRTAARLAH